MFAKLSALALCLSFVSALQIQVEAEVLELAKVSVDLIVASGDPTRIDLYLEGVATPDIYPLLKDVGVAAIVDVDIPVVAHPDSQYQILAVKVDDLAVVYARSNDVIVKAA